MNFFKSAGYVLLGLVSVAYLLNPTAGVFELIPDNLPVIGNLDEVGAVLLLLKSLQHFGIGFKGSDRSRDVVTEAEHNEQDRQS